jgi:hypothetical protein
MARLKGRLETEQANDEFDAHARLTILRRALAELVIARTTSGAELVSLRRELCRLCALTEGTLLDPELVRVVGERRSLGAACAGAALTVRMVRQRLEQPSAKRPSRALLELSRRRAYQALARIAERLAASDAFGEVTRGRETELSRALCMRRLMSDFQDAMLTGKSARSSAGWALRVALAELGILLRYRAVARGPETERRELSRLRQRIASFRQRSRNAASASKLRSELMDTSRVLAALNVRPEVRRHDNRALLELSALFTLRKPILELAYDAADTLVELRGMDRELDRLIASLPLDPPRILALISRRVGELRALSLAS